MNGMITEHHNKSFILQSSSQALQGVGEAGSRFARTPWQNIEPSVHRWLFAEPQSDRGYLLPGGLRESAVFL
jgi:hypothetical protein